MESMDYHPSNYLWAKLVEVLQSQQTGTFFIASQENASGRLALVQGSITHCAYQRLHGIEAVQALTKLEAGRCSFMPNMAYPFRELDQVESEVALGLLGLTQALKVLPTTSTPNSVSKPVSVLKKVVNNRYYRGYVVPE